MNVLGQPLCQSVNNRIECSRVLAACCSVPKMMLDMNEFLFVYDCLQMSVLEVFFRYVIVKWHP